MPPLESPLNASCIPHLQAHQHAANADDYMAQGLLMPAAEEHYKAAEAFEAALQAATEEHTKRTLRMLYNEHSKAGKELQRKIAKLREENKDPSLPQRVPSRNVAPAMASASVPPVGSSVASPQNPSSPPPQLSTGRLSDSQQMVDESFMLLGQKSETSDAFNHFWKITEGMLDYLSQPVAFATAPLAPPENNPSSSRRREGNGSDTDVEDTLTKTFNRGLDFVKAAGTRMLVRHDSSGNVLESSAKPGISTFPPKPITDDWEDDLEADEEDMADSFCIVPSKSDQSVALLKKENAAIKAQLDEERKKLAAAERMLKQRQEQDQHLRESIMLARKEAHRAMTSSMALRPPAAPPLPAPVPIPALAQISPVEIPGLTINVPPPPPPPTAVSPGPGRERNEAQLLRRVRELEEELRTVRAENEKQRAIIVKFRDRWEKLKESSRRKKEARAAAGHTSVANERIEEEPEAEAAAEKEDERPRKHTEGPILS
ncbi:hypothetical protein NM688_g1918 [Phlebia brevispora]|uniref:Uncharacterized protein n=1 Tax=Phlebia brevispora TaxID=194682 RepID=A0ACC1TAC2_9APHY|nr:hypothetical protein NM688_g1918 [Phlebia brevispora]